MKRTAAKSGGGPRDFIAPCLATSVSEPPSGPSWVHEVKFDGYRLQAQLHAGSVRLLTRTGLDWTARFNRLAVALQCLDLDSALIDGEVVVEAATGVSSFVDLVRDLKAGRSDRMVFFAFDLLYANGEDLTHLPLLDRKARLAAFLAIHNVMGPVRFSRHFEVDGAVLLAKACEMGLEGIISKRIDKPYRSGRGQNWLKSKCVLSDEFVIIGYLVSSASDQAVGALVVGFHHGWKMTYAGRVGTGFTRTVAHALYQTLADLRVATSPVAPSLDRLQRRDVVWVKPSLVAQIDYRGWTEDGLLRHASFKSLREDKAPRSVTRPGSRPVR